MPEKTNSPFPTTSPKDKPSPNFTKLKIIIILTLPFLVGILHFSLSEQNFFPIQLFGHKTKAMFDLWSFQHFVSGIIFGSFFAWLHGRAETRPRQIILYAFIIAFTWEILEVFFEAGTFGQTIATWKAGFEHWSNRLCGDPLLVTLGYWLGNKHKKYWLYFLIPTLVWLLLNIFSPDSMYIQKILLAQNI